MDNAVSKPDAEKIKIYTPLQAFLCAFIGGPIPAVYALKKNYDSLGNDNAAGNILLWGTILTILLAFVVLFLPKGFPNTAIPIAYAFCTKSIAESTQMKKANIDASELYTAQSGLNVVAVCAIGFLASICLFIAVALILHLFMPHYTPSALRAK